MKFGRHSDRTKHGAIALWMGMFVGGTALADTPSEDLSSLDLHTLMQMDVTLVNAQKRTEDANTVPISMTVLKASDIGGANMGSTSDLQMMAPGLTTSTYLSLVLPYIRGVGTDTNTNGVEPSVALYVDGVYQSERMQTDIDLADVAQIEILRGPQGTLYGRNATGGAINITTRGPTSELVADVSGEAGNLNLRAGNLFIAGPVNDRLRLSFAANTRERDGYYTNVFDGSKVNNQNFFSLHGRAQLDITENLTTELMLRYSKRNDNNLFGTVVSPVSVGSLLGLPVASAPYQTAVDLQGPHVGIDVFTAALKLDWNGSWLHVQSLTSRTATNVDFSIDVDNTIAPLENVFGVEKDKAVTQEFQLSPTQKSDRFDWIVGVFYFDAQSGISPYLAQVSVPGFGQFTQTLRGQVETRAGAAFGEATTQLSGGFSLTAGLRYSDERKKLSGASTQAANFPAQVAPDGSHRWSDANYRLVLKYMRDQAMIYAKTETGFKSGAYNTGNIANPGPINPEKITAYEIGLKNALANFPVRMSFAGFYNDYRDLQMQVAEETSAGLTRFVQAPKARTYGVDAGLEWKVTSHLNLSAGANWLNAKYLQFVTDGVFVATPAGNAPAQGYDLGGNWLSRSPEFTANVAGTFTYPVAQGQLISSANYYRSSRYYFDQANQSVQDSFGVLNARIGYQAAQHWSVFAWSRNLTNERYFNWVKPDNFGTLGQYAEPRTYGLQINYQFAR
jgi:iron complex outermembrane receptor protein